MGIYATIPQQRYLNVLYLEHTRLNKSQRLTHIKLCYEQEHEILRGKQGGSRIQPVSITHVIIICNTTKANGER